MSSNNISFEQLGLSTDLLRAISDQGYTNPTPIQQQAIPVILRGCDVMGGAQTGTGKTAGFTLPMLQRLEGYANSSTSPAKHPVRALILVPTRELAIQVYESIKAYGKYIALKSTVIYGGVNIDVQIAAIRSGVEILVATPGRLLDHLQQKNLVLSKVEILILDEADRMLDMGFLPDIKQIIQMLPDQRQNLMFSATFSEEIKKLAGKILKEPTLIEVAKQNSVSDLITHIVYSVESKSKQEFLIDMIKKKNLQQVLIFIRTKHGADRLAQKLNNREILSSVLHGDRNQLQRTQALDNFKCGLIRALVATDVAARGLDIEELTHVINFELPNNPEDYVHRIGRTGRAGARGFAISFVSREESSLLDGIEKLLGIKIQIKESSFRLKDQQNISHAQNNNINPVVKKDPRIIPFKKELISKRPRRIEKIEDPLFSQPYMPKYSDLASVQEGIDGFPEKIIHKQYPRKLLPALFIPPVISKQK